MSPIEEDELKRSTLVKQIQQYQQQLDEVGAGDDATTKTLGTFNGKKVTVSEQNPQMNALFNKSITQ